MDSSELEQRWRELLCEIEAAEINGDNIYSWQGRFQTFRDLAHRENCAELTRSAQLELESLSFRPKGAKLSNQFSRTDSSGHSVSWPDLSGYRDEDRLYVAGRAASTRNDFLLSRYHHILWCLPGRHGDNARTASDAYSRLAERDFRGALVSNNRLLGHSAVESLKVAHALSKSAGSDGIHVVDHCARSLLGFMQADKNHSIQLQLMGFLADNNMFPEFIRENKLTEHCWSLGKGSLGPNDVFAAEAYFKMGLRLDHLIGESNHEWHYAIGEAYERIADLADPSSWAAQHFGVKALESYQEAMASEKVKSVSAKLQAMKEQVRYQTYESKVDLTEYVRECEHNAEVISDSDSASILNFLIHDPMVVPDWDSVLKSAIRARRPSGLLPFFTQQMHDRRGNLIKTVQPEEQDDLNAKQLYQYHVEWQIGILLGHIIHKSIQKEKLAASSFISFLKESTWIGQYLTVHFGSDEAITYRWLDGVAPAINIFFSELDRARLSQSYKPDFTLFCDSIVLKIEGMIRDICRGLGVATSTWKRVKGGKKLEVEKDLSELLVEPELQALLGPNESFFFRYVLTDRLGLGLRHKIAHSLALPGEYSQGIANLLLLVVLRLCRFSVTVQNTTDLDSKTPQDESGENRDPSADPEKRCGEGRGVSAGSASG